MVFRILIKPKLFLGDRFRKLYENLVTKLCFLPLSGYENLTNHLHRKLPRTIHLSAHRTPLYRRNTKRTRFESKQWIMYFRPSVMGRPLSGHPPTSNLSIYLAPSFSQSATAARFAKCSQAFVMRSLKPDYHAIFYSTEPTSCMHSRHITFREGSSSCTYCINIAHITKR